MDEENLQKKVAEWKEADPSAEFFLRLRTVAESKCKDSTLQTATDRGFTSESDDEYDDVGETTSNQFLFIHQSAAQIRLLSKYGDIALLDATYKTTKYSLPLLLLVVRTNVGYMTVAEFICEVETASAISEAMGIILQWNPDWSASYWMVDYSEAEYQALKSTFPQARIYQCAFHREQAWVRWVRDGMFT